MKIIITLLLLFCFVIALALSTQNQAIVNFNYLAAQGEFRLSSLLGISFAGGFIVGWLFCGALYVKQKMANSLLRSQVTKQRDELNNLRIEAPKE
ncbi:MAG: LapA family protein [Enterovibrio sp.]